MRTLTQVNSLLLFGVIPLFIAVYANKVDFIVAIDLSVWLLAIFALFYLVRTPWKIYFLLQTKTREVEEKESRGVHPSATEKEELNTLSQRMLALGWATPFLTIAGWFGLAEYCSGYNLNSMTEIIHPYVILFIGIAAGLIPVQSYYERIKKELIVPEPPQDADRDSDVVQTVLNQLVNSEGTIKQLTKNVQQEMEKMQQNSKRFDRELRLLKKACKAESEAKLSEINRLERKVIGLENQVELMHLLAKDKEIERKGLLASFFHRKWI